MSLIVSYTMTVLHKDAERLGSFMRPVQAYVSFWQNYFNFKGRSTRSEFWWVFLWNAPVFLFAIFSNWVLPCLPVQTYLHDAVSHPHLSTIIVLIGDPLVISPLFICCRPAWIQFARTSSARYRYARLVVYHRHFSLVLCSCRLRLIKNAGNPNFPLRRHF